MFYKYRKICSLTGRKAGLSLCLILCLALSLLTGCAGQSGQDDAEDKNASVETEGSSQADQESNTSDDGSYATTEEQEVTTSALSTETVEGQTDMIQASQEVFAMDTYMTVTAYGSEAAEAVTEAVSEIQRLDTLWSVGNMESEIARINNSGSEILSEETAALIQGSLDLYEMTEGRFDITIYPLMDEWGFTTQNYKVPTQERIDELLQKVDASAMDFDADSRTLTLPEGVQIDLGGIAKGYTSAHIMEIFDKYDVVSGLVSLGGNVQAYQSKVDGSAWRVGIENPDTTVGQLKNVDYVGVLSIVNKAVITSGGYERYFEEDGQTYHHILDPATGYPSDSGLISVTIVSEDGLLADGLSTSLFIMGQEKAIDFWREHKDAFDAVLIDKDGNITITAGLQDAFESNLTYQVAE